MTFADLTRRYLAAGCPDRRGMQRRDDQQALEASRLANLKRHFGRLPLTAIGIRECAAYGAKHRDRPRAADLDLQTLSNLCWFAVLEGILTSNPVMGRAKHRKSRDVVHCRESMPEDADELHLIARELLSRPASESAAWQMLTEAFTGCRTSETLALRMDAVIRGQPGCVEGEHLYVRRAKSGGNPFVRLTGDLRALIDAHHDWHARRYPDSPWWFPGPSIAAPLDRLTLTAALRRICPRLGLARITSHGLRAFYVTAHRSRGLPDEQVAALIGTASVELIRSTYGALPESWSGGEPLGWMPRNGPAAWISVNETRIAA